MKITKKERKNIIKSVAYFASASLALAIRVPLLQYRYLAQCLVAVAVVMYFLFLRSLKNVLPQAARDKISGTVRAIAKYIRQTARKINASMRKLLHLPENRKRMRGSDERSFVFDNESNPFSRKSRFSKKALKWRDTADNAEKIRYIYMKFMLNAIRRGFKFNRALTPNENADKMKLADDKRALFSLYNTARYANDTSDITDSDVSAAAKLINKKA